LILATWADYSSCGWRIRNYHSVLENGDAPIIVNVKGLSVRIWVEKGLLFALTEESGLEPD
jgi:hypothetical protein